jgi:hypothetical protein
VLAVFFDSQPIYNSPFSFDIFASQPWVPAFTASFPFSTDCNPGSGCATIQFVCTAGKEASFLIQSRDFWGNKRRDPEFLELQLKAYQAINDDNVSNREVNGTVNGPLAGIYYASFTITISGMYFIRVFSNTQAFHNISGVPFTYAVRPSSIFPSLCFIVDKKTAFKSSAGVPATFSIQVIS